MLKRSISLLLALVLCLPLLLACADGERAVDIVKKGESEYVIVCPSGTDSESKAENNAALRLFEGIRDKTDVELERKSDAQTEEADADGAAKEILVGATNRAESQKHKEGLRLKDYLITFENDCVIILGGSAEATADAVEYFLSDYINTEEKTVTVYTNRIDEKQYNYLLGDLTVNGIPLSRYKIVYPASAEKAKDSTLIAYYTAVALADYLEQNGGLRLKVSDDTAKEAEYEILIGTTNRTASQKVKDTALNAGDYLLLTDGNKLVLWGDSYMVAGAAGALMNVHFKSQGMNVAINATDIPSTPTPKTFVFEKATSAILMIGDGMGSVHVDATLDSGKLVDFVARDLPHQSLCTTASQSVLDKEKGYTDSAAAATALATGYKTVNGYVGMDKNKTVRQNVRELAHAMGAQTGVLTTDAITGATPAGFLCHHNKRDDASTLQKQINALTKNDEIDYCKGDVNTLAPHARTALNQLALDNGDFFFMIEEAHIDKRSHEGDKSMGKMQDCVVRYNECIAYVIAFVMLHPYTALIITADHETGGLEKQPNGSYKFTNNTSATYWQHTNNHAPIFGLGYGVENLVQSGVITDNTLVAKHIASIFGSNDFGQ